MNSKQNDCWPNDSINILSEFKMTIDRMTAN